jgi:protein-disulfide isomerase
MISEEALAMMQVRHKRKRTLIKLGIAIAILILIPFILLTIRTVRYYHEIKNGNLTSFDQVRLSKAVTSQSATGTLSMADRALLVPTSTIAELGNKDASLTVVEFVDYQCEYSKEMFAPVRKLMEQEPYKSRIHFVIRDYPVTELHPDARNSAHAVKCILEQGESAYWRYSALLFSDQLNLSSEALHAKANLAKVNTARFDECMAERRYDVEIDRDIEFAKRIGVEGTPTMFLNGIPVQGSMNEENLAYLFDTALSELAQ